MAGLEDRWFRELPALLRPGDLLVVNDTRVRRARLHGVDEAGRDVELLVLTREDSGDVSVPGAARASGHPGRRHPHRRRSPAPPWSRCRRCIAVDARSRSTPRTPTPRSSAPASRRCPPTSTPSCATPSGTRPRMRPATPDSAAAPTAGLHFTAAVIERLREAGIGWATLRLDVGLGDVRADPHRPRRGSPDARGAIRAPSRDRGGDRARRSATVGASSRSGPPSFVCSRPARDDGSACAREPAPPACSSIRAIAFARSTGC